MSSGQSDSEEAARINEFLAGLSDQGLSRVAYG